MTPRTSSKRITFAILALVLVILVAAGCGGSDSSSDSSSATTSTTASSSSFSDCLKQNGVEGFDPSQLGAGGGPPEGVDPAALQKAMQACQSLAPQGGAPGGAPSGGQSGAQFQKFQQCMKDNGVDSFGPGTQGSRSQADQAKINKARQACASLAPQGGFPQGGPPQGGSGGAGGNFTAFSRCMKRNGAPLPGSGSTATVDTSSATYRNAQKKCQPLLTGGQSQ